MSIKILLADDSITIQKVVGIIFGGDDYSLTVVDNGKAAVEKAQEVNPDILLIDALMPGMSGYEVCEAVRAIPSLAAKPIILLTGTFEKFDEDKAKSCGANDSMAKPFESQQIISKVKEMLELGATRSSAPVSTVAAPEPVVEPEPANAPTIQFDTEEPSANDIWDAFTPLEEPAPAAETRPLSPEPAKAEEADAFAMFHEEPEADSTVFDMIAEPANESTGSKWVPAEEETFEFADETVVELPSDAFDEPPAVTEASALGDIPFAEPAAPEVEQVAFIEPEEPAFSEPVAPVVAPAAVAEAVNTAAAVPAALAAVPVDLTEDQLRAAITGASREVIERIVWEVVPDLAEAMIREAIQKIKQGV